MFPLLTGLLTGGASLLGSMFSSSTAQQNNQAQIQAQQQSQQEAEQFNAGQAQISRDYNTQMSNTAYQRAKTDMTAAGLNPMMMTGGAMNASTPSSPTPSITPQQIPVSQSKGALSGIGEAAERAVSSAVAAKSFDKMTDEIANLEQTRKEINARTDLLSQQRLTEAERKPLVRQETATEEQRTGLVSGERRAVEQRAIEGDALKGATPEVRDNLIRWGYYGRKASDVVAPVLSTAKTVMDYGLTGQVGRFLRSMYPSSTPGSAKSSKAEIDDFIEKARRLGNRRLGTGGSYD